MFHTRVSDKRWRKKEGKKYPEQIQTECENQKISSWKKEIKYLTVNTRGKISTLKSLWSHFEQNFIWRSCGPSITKFQNKGASACTWISYKSQVTTLHQMHLPTPLRQIYLLITLHRICSVNCLCTTHLTHSMALPQLQTCILTLPCPPRSVARPRDPLMLTLPQLQTYVLTLPCPPSSGARPRDPLIMLTHGIIRNLWVGD